MHWDLAESGYRSALAKGTLKNVGACFRLASVLHAAGRTESARIVLEEIERIAPIGIDRKLARRRIGQLAWPRVGDPALLKCTVLAARLPEHFERWQPFAATFRLRNDGDTPWIGGWDIAAAELHLRFVNASGAIVDRVADQNFANHLPEGGVNPGEEVEVMLLGVGPDEVGRGALTLSFRGRRARYPNEGLVWRESPVSAPTSR